MWHLFKTKPRPPRPKTPLELLIEQMRRDVAAEVATYPKAK